MRAPWLPPSTQPQTPTGGNMTPQGLEQWYSQMMEIGNKLGAGPLSQKAYNEFKEKLDQQYAQYSSQLTGNENQANREMAMGRYKEITDPSSQYYQKINQQVRDNLSSVYNPNSLIALGRSQGMSSGGASTIANQQNKAIQKRINESANQASNQAFINAGSQANSLLGLMQSGTGQSMQNYSALANLNMGYSQLAENRRQYEDSKPGFFDYLGGIAGTVAGDWAGGLFGNSGGNGLNYSPPAMQSWGGTSGYGYSQTNNPWKPYGG